MDEIINNLDNLTELDFCSIYIKMDALLFLCHELESNTTIRRLSFTHILLNPINFDNIGQMLQKNTYLTELKLISVNTNQYMLGLKYLANSLKKNNSLTTLNLSRNNINEKSIKYVADILTKNSSLKNLYLSQNMIHSNGVLQIANALKINTSLKNLDLSVNYISSIGAEYISDTLLTFNNLKKLNLSCNQILTEGISCLSNALKYNKSLRIIDLSLNTIHMNSIRYIGEALSHNETLHTLLLGCNNNINNEIHQLIPYLEKNHHLKSIGLHTSHMTDYDISFICDALIENKIHIKNLYISYNQISGCRSISDVLSKNILMELEFSCNLNIEDSKYMGDSLKQNNTLERLVFHAPEIKGLTHIVSALVGHPTLMYFSICGLYVDEEEFDDIIHSFGKLLKYNKSLSRLSLSHSNIEFICNLQYIQDILNTNSSIIEIDFDKSVCPIKFVDFVCKRNIYNNLQKRITLMELAN